MNHQTVASNPPIHPFQALKFIIGLSILHLGTLLLFVQLFRAM